MKQTPTPVEIDKIFDQMIIISYLPGADFLLIKSVKALILQTIYSKIPQGNGITAHIKKWNIECLGCRMSNAE